MLSKCGRCYELYFDYQRAFPLKPFYEHKVVIQLDTQALRREGVKNFTTRVLSEINTAYKQQVGITFTNAISEINTTGLELKKTGYAKVKAKRQTERHAVHCNYTYMTMTADFLYMRTYTIINL